MIVDAKKPTRLCNPADKNDEDPSAPFHPDHLEDYAIKGPKFTKVTNLTVTNRNQCVRISG